MFAAEVVAWLIGWDFGRHIRPVGLTGGIASGKSTVSQRLGQAGVAVVDADRIAASVLDPGTREFKVPLPCRHSTCDMRSTP